MRLGSFRVWRLKLWLRLMAACERHGAEESALYRFATRRAMACNPWRKWT